MPHQRTYSAKAKDIKHEWHVVDMTDKVLGRAASQIATLLKGKHKPMYTPSIDTGDHVVVINAEKVKVTGNKASQKKYFRMGVVGMPGTAKITDYTTLQRRHPEDIIFNAVRRMLPRNALGRQMMTKLRVYTGDKHPHVAQKPAAKQVIA
jgi:large subunit ribosomal protein L13